MKRLIIGNLGSIFAALCCIGTPALLTFLASVGMGFLIKDLILLPLLLVFLAIALWGVIRSKAVHQRPGPSILAVVGSVVVFAAVWFSPPLVLLGLAGLILASIWDMYLHKTCAPSSAEILGSGVDSA